MYNTSNDNLPLVYSHVLHESTHYGDFIDQILRLSMTALMLICRVKRSEIDEICSNSSYIGVNWWGFYKAQTGKLYSPINL
jgi:hypothetical protein